MLVPWVLRGLINDIVYTYGSKLEKSSPKLSQPGDFLTYLIFVCSVILVGSLLYSPLITLYTSHYLPA